MSFEEVLKVVFPLLEGTDLASCMLVCKQWQAIALDDYLWKCQCGKRWPSLCKRTSPPSTSYYKLFQSFYKRQKNRAVLPPRFSSKDIEFYIDIWAEGESIFSEVVPASVLQNGLKLQSRGISNMPRLHLDGPEYKMTLEVEPRLSVPVDQDVRVSVLVGRKDTNKVACIINNSLFDYMDRTAYRALAFDYIELSPSYPFVSGIRAWISLLFTENSTEEVINVCGIEMDFCDVANSEDEAMWLLDMLDWK
ncbi:F-box protein At5g39250 [Impatiens glandulifera]|uniref:F-box protein At5g39250 n=1 Tax=Impatiens glandulifera TaxID=253017 RepID=UPI001FB06F81|nr:F-box protein At5g39250 [Impatiens glandulifera]XP_047310331.1 F-box protein At5g39250 [Impatiens glandulifera]